MCGVVLFVSSWRHCLIGYEFFAVMAPSITSTGDGGHLPADQDQKSNCNSELKPRCMGRCEIALGDVTHHNVQVAVRSFFNSLSCS